MGGANASGGGGGGQQLLGAVGPAWTRGEIEGPAGERDMGGWTAGFYTPEQQARLGVDEQGGPAAAAAAGNAGSLWEGDCGGESCADDPAAAAVAAVEDPADFAARRQKTIDDIRRRKAGKAGNAGGGGGGGGVHLAPNGQAFPAAWGAPPRMQTKDLRPLPGGYGRGSGTLARWIKVSRQRTALDPPPRVVCPR